MRISLHWYNYDDLDLHMYGHIYYADLLDVGSAFEERNNPKKFSRNAIENIIFSGIPKAGTYKVFVNNFAKVENIDLGFEVKLNGVIFTKEHLSSTAASKEIWGVKTQNFVEVSAICLSPNYWGNNKVGAKHYFFMLKDCKNPDAFNSLKIIREY